MKGARTNQKKRMIGWYLHENAAAIASWADVDFVGLLSRTTWRGDKLRRVNRVACGGCVISVGVKPACSAFDSAKVSSGPGPTQCFFVCRQSQRRFQDFQMVCSNCHGTEVAVPSRRCTYVCVWVFVVAGVTCTRAVSWAPDWLILLVLLHEK